MQAATIAPNTAQNAAGLSLLVTINGGAAGVAQTAARGDTEEESEQAAAMAQGDFELNEQGLYVATRQFLLRRGYCCGCGCRNCPYIGTELDRYPSARPRPAAPKPRQG